MHVKVLRPDHPEITEVVASHHCVQRFRKRKRIKEPGLAAVEASLQAALEEADFTRWPPPWVITRQSTALWALLDDIAFPLIATPDPGRWLATTCLVRAAAM